MHTQETAIYKVFGENLKTREIAKELFVGAFADSPVTVVFDFAQVEFVSRSFAHEFISLKQIQNELGRTVILENKSETVVEMFEAVTNSLQTTRVRPSKVKTSTFETFEALSTFLSTI